jgi:hypothetical protein
MATFKVGQRVRLVSATFTSPAIDFVGREATIVAIPSRNGERDCSIDIDGADARQFGSKFPSFNCSFARLAPLTDPKADAFLESIRQLKPLQIPEVA